MKRYYTNALDSHVFEHVDGPFVRWEDHQARVKVLEGALLSLLPGLVLDRRYADADDDIDAMDSRIATVQEALAPEATK